MGEPEPLRAVLQSGSSGSPAQRARRAAAALAQTSLDEVAALLNDVAGELEASHRQFRRLGFDLHDGPLQDIAALAAELHLFRDQLADLARTGSIPTPIVGRVDDVAARLATLDRDLRRLTLDLESSALDEGPLPVAVAETVAAVNGACDVTLEIDDQLDHAAMTASQRIAVIRVVQAALANVVRHSGARHASVAVRAVEGGIEAEIVDDGHGFDVRAARRQARERGRLGLLAMSERVRFLEGELRIESKPGGPTRVRAFLPKWAPARDH